MFLGHAPDLDSQWQVVIVTENLLFSLQDMLAMRLGLQFMRQEDAVALAREQESIDHMLTVNRVLLDSWKLSAAQKVLLRWNSSLTRNRSCSLLTKGSDGHNRVIVSFQCDMHGLKSGSETGGGPSWSILIGSQGTLLCHFLTCMMGMLATRFTISGSDSW